MKITHIDVATDTNTELEVTQKEFTEMVGKLEAVKPFAQVIEEKQALKDAAIAKLAALGLTEDEARAVIG
jgi:hypothetical protein